MGNPEMYSLSDLINLYVKAHESEFKARNREALVKLDPKLPKLYNDIEKNPFCTPFIQITDEATKADATKIRYETMYSRGGQTLIIYHNGRQVPNRALETIKQELEAIAHGTRHTSLRHGNQLSAQAVQKYGGRVTLENLSDGEYTVRTIIKVPIFTT